jgi:hypothetical protein
LICSFNYDVSVEYLVLITFNSYKRPSFNDT